MLSIAHYAWHIPQVLPFKVWSYGPNQIIVCHSSIDNWTKLDICYNVIFNHIFILYFMYSLLLHIAHVHVQYHVHVHVQYTSCNCCSSIHYILCQLKPNYLCGISLPLLAMCPLGVVLFILWASVEEWRVIWLTAAVATLTSVTTPTIFWMWH